MRAALIALVISALAPLSAVAVPVIAPLAATSPAMPLSALNGQPHVVLLWRSDCAPCLIELQNFAALEAATGAGRLVTIAIEPVGQARQTLHQFNVPPHPAFVAQGDATVFLEAISDGGRRLPLALALDRRGHICARHVGLLGTDLARAWIRQCSR